MRLSAAAAAAVSVCRRRHQHTRDTHDDTNVVMLVANPHFKAATVSATTTTTRVAPTIVNALGLDPTALDAVREEGTTVLPEVALQLSGGW
jgi:hypothetical protein